MMATALSSDAYSLRLDKDDPMKGISLELHVHEDSEEGVGFLGTFRVPASGI